MRARRPHYFLRTQAAAPPAPPRWAFSLQAAAKLQNDIQSPPITAGDLEPNASWERLQLLAVVRGLEALPEPALVTLATASDVVRRGIRHGLEEWREMDWQLELFGELIPVKNADLWRRIDRALAIHDVQIRNVRVDEPIVAEQSEQPHFVPETTKARRAQTALSGIGNGKLSHGFDSVQADDTHGSSGATPSWSSEKTAYDQAWDTGSKWHDEDDTGDFDHEIDEAYEHIAAQKSGSTRESRHTSKKAPAIRKSLTSQNVTFKDHPKRPFSLLRVRRRLRASRLHVQRRFGELWNSWLWFYEVTGLPQFTRTSKPFPPPWLRDQQQREQPHRS